MKKIFTLTLWVLLTLSTFAIPQSKKAALGQLPDKQSLRQTEMIKSVYQGVPRTASKMAKAPKATTSVTILAYTALYYSSYNIYIYDLTGDNGLTYSFAFPSTGEDMVVEGQTYTLSDMDAEWSYWYDDSFDYADYTTASFTKTTDASGNVKIIASVTDTNGDVWNLLYDQASLPETPKGGTYSASSVEANYFSSSSDIQYALEFEEDKLKFYFDIILPSGVKDVESGKTYTLTDMDEDYSFGQYNSANYIIFSSASRRRFLHYRSGGSGRGRQHMESLRFAGCTLCQRTDTYSERHPQPRRWSLADRGSRRRLHHYCQPVRSWQFGSRRVHRG